MVALQSVGPNRRMHGLIKLLPPIMVGSVLTLPARRRDGPACLDRSAARHGLPGGLAYDTHAAYGLAIMDDAAHPV